MTDNKNKLSFSLKPLMAGLAVAFAACQAMAGLGALRVLSSPGEAFYAEIPVEPEYGLASPTAILAPLDRYSMLGPYSSNASALLIRTREVEPGQYMISIAGPNLASDENLHFALELVWPSGRVVREYHVPSSGGQPGKTGRKEPVPVAPPLDPQKLLPSDLPPSLGDARLLSVRGLPFRVELPLLGKWPERADLAEQFYLTDLLGVSGATEHRFELVTKRGMRLLRINGKEPVSGQQLGFRLSVKLGKDEISRQFVFVVPEQGRRTAKIVSKATGDRADGYRVKSGDTLSKLAARFAPEGGTAHWMTAVVASNPHAFAKGNPDVIFSGAWLVWPARDVVAKADTLPRQDPPVRAVAGVDASAVAAAEPKQQIMPSGERDLVAKRLGEAQQRMRWLEAEIDRLARQASSMPAVVVPLSPEEDRFLDEKLEEWLLAGAGGLSVASLLAWMLWRRRKGKSKHKVVPVSFTTTTSPMTVSAGLPAGQRPLAQPTIDAINIDAIDVFAEADVLMAYGRFDAAENLLRETLRSEPGREDVRMKLLDLIARKGNRAEFEEVALDVLAVFGPDSGLWVRVQQLGQSLDPDNPLYKHAERQQPRATFILDDAKPEMPLNDDWQEQLLAEPLGRESREVPLPEVSVQDMAASDPREVSVMRDLPPDSQIAELVKLYREMGDNEAADALLKEAGLLPPARESV